MGELSSREEVVAQHYNTAILAYESDRLTTGQQIEFAITARYLQRYVPAGAVVADVGVGVGHYAELLARQGCSVHLVDIAQTLLNTATTRLRGAGLERQVLSVRRASATHLAHLDTASCDVVLLLGPLYHLCDPAERVQAVGEAARALKPGACCAPPRSTGWPTCATCSANHPARARPAVRFIPSSCAMQPGPPARAADRLRPPERQRGVPPALHRRL